MFLQRNSSILSTKRSATFLFAFFGGYKSLLISKIVLFQRFCLAIKTLIAQFRHKLDTVLCLESKIQKSEFLNKKKCLMSYLIKFRFECDLRDLAH